MSESTLGTIRGQMILDVKQALAAYTAARSEHVTTVTALHTGAGAMTQVGVGLAAAGAGLAAGLMVAVNAAAEFEKRLDYFAAVSGATQDEYDAIREKALQLGEDTIYSANEIAESFVELSKSGVNTRDVLDGIGEAVANLGSATDIPLTEAAASLTTILNSFQLSANEAVGVVDKLAGAANASSIDVGDLITTMTYAGASAATAGISFEDINNAIALLGERGIKGSKAGTGLRQVIDKLIAPTKKGAGALKELGIMTEDGANALLNAEGNLRPIPELLDTLNASLDGMTQSEKMDILGKIFPITSLPTVLNLLDAGADGMARINEEVNKTTAMDIASQRLDNLAGDIEILQGNIETLLIDSGGKFQEFARGLVQGVTDILQWFTDLPDSLQTAILWFTAISAVLLIVVGSVGIFAGQVMNIIALIIQLNQVFPLLKTGITVVTTAMRAFTVSLLTNPVFLIIAAIVALIAIFVVLWNRSEAFRNFWKGLWATIKDAALEVWDWIKGLPDWFSGVWDDIKSTAESTWNNVINFFRSIPGMLMDAFLNFTLPGLLIQHWDSIWEGITSAWNGILDWFQELPSRIANFFAELPEKVAYWFFFLVGRAIRLWAQLQIFIYTTAAQIITSVVEWFSQLPARVTAFILDMYNRVTTWFTQLAVDIAAKSVEIYNSVITWFQELPGRVATFFTELYNSVVNWLVQTAIDVAVKAQEIYTSVVNWFQQLPGRAQEFFTQLWQNIVNGLTNAWNDAVTLGSRIYNGIVDGIKNIPDEAKKIFDNVVKAVKGAISGAFNAVKDLASSMWDGFRDGLGIHSPSYIEHAMWDITDVVTEETNRLKGQVRTLQGLGNGISRMGENIGFSGSGFDSSLTTLANQVAQAQDMQAQLTGLAGTASMSSQLAMNSQVAPTNQLANQVAEKLASQPQRVVNQEVTIINPVTERDSTSTDKALQLAAAVDS